MIEHSTEYTDHNLQVYNCLLITILTTFLHGDYLHLVSFCIFNMIRFSAIILCGLPQDPLHVVPVWGGSWSAVSCQINGWVDTSCQLSAAIMQWCSSCQPGCSAPRQAAASMTLLTGGGQVRIMPSPRPGHMTPVHNPGLKHLTI